MPSPIKKGVTTIYWGSSGVALDHVGGIPLAAAIVMRAAMRPKNAAPVEIEDNDGFALAQFLLVDGFTATLECLFDSAITWPTEGDIVFIKRPRDADDLACYVVSIEDPDERKKEATISLAIQCFAGIEDEPTVPGGSEIHTGGDIPILTGADEPILV